MFIIKDMTQEQPKGRRAKGRVCRVGVEEVGGKERPRPPVGPLCQHLDVFTNPEALQISFRSFYGGFSIEA